MDTPRGLSLEAAEPHAKEPVMKKGTRYVGMDVRKRSIALAMRDPSGAVSEQMIPHEPRAIVCWVSQAPRRPTRTRDRRRGPSSPPTESTLPPHDGSWQAAQRGRRCHRSRTGWLLVGHACGRGGRSRVRRIDGRDEHDTEETRDNYAAADSVVTMRDVRERSLATKHGHAALPLGNPRISE